MDYVFAIRDITGRIDNINDPKVIQELILSDQPFYVYSHMIHYETMNKLISEGFTYEEFPDKYVPHGYVTWKFYRKV